MARGACHSIYGPRHTFPPRWPNREARLAEPLRVHGLGGNAAERNARVRQALADAGLKPVESYLQRRPHELSGGQRQRVVIASALVLEPKVLLADEPVSMLDVSIRAEILNLLADLRTQRNISALFITHDLSTVASFADRVAVILAGVLDMARRAEIELVGLSQHQRRRRRHGCQQYA